MDPIAHTLVGATMAETGLKRTTALGTATLITGANLPDIDGIARIFGSDASHMHRRGWTHGILAMIVFPLALTGLMLAIDRLWRARKRPDTSAAPSPDPPVEKTDRARFLPLLLLSCLSVWSHPFLDWCNPYGVRLLMPFDGSWFYGDALFIVDPLLWLLGACAVVLAHSKGKLSRVGWAVLLLATTALVTGSSRTPPEAKIVWCIGGGLILYLRMSGNPINVARTAIICSSMMAIYVATMLVGTSRAGTRAATWLQAQGMRPSIIAPTPMAARPFHRDVIVLVDGVYHFLDVAWLGSSPIRPSGQPAPVGDRNEIVEAALRAPSISGAANWLRFPTYQTEKLPDGGFRVTITDVRYSRSRPKALGTVVVELDSHLREREI